MAFSLGFAKANSVQAARGFSSALLSHSIPYHDPYHNAFCLVPSLLPIFVHLDFFVRQLLRLAITLCGIAAKTGSILPSRPWSQRFWMMSASSKRSCGRDTDVSSMIRVARCPTQRHARDGLVKWMPWNWEWVNWSWRCWHLGWVSNLHAGRLELWER